MGRVAITDSMPDFTGQFIDNGRLKLLESLGSGAYGKVYRAIEVTSPLDKPMYYAVKCLLKPERGSHQEEFQNREFTLHQMVCDHLNIVTFHKVIYEGHYVYVVLDLCTGGDLFAAITETQVFHNNVQLIKDSFVQLIDAVQYCHENAVFHRDIKPENVLCSERGTDLRLADFGLAIRSHVSSDFGCGSSYYMSPGQFITLIALNSANVSHIPLRRMYQQRAYRRQVLYPTQRYLVFGCDPHEYDFW